MQLKDVMTKLERLGDPQIRAIHQRHGAMGNYFGVRVGDLKPLAKELRGQQELALALYATKNGDAMYLAGLIADGAEMSKKELDGWAAAATWQMISEYTVPWVTSDHPAANEFALKWIDAKKEHVAAAGWNTYACLANVRPDAELDLAEIERLLGRVEEELDGAPNRVRYCMNGFVIAAGGAVKPLHAKAKATAKRIGVVSIDVGDTECKVPAALAMLQKLEQMGRIGKKRKAARC